MGARSHDVNSSPNLGRSSDLMQSGRFGMFDHGWFKYSLAAPVRPDFLPPQSIDL